MNKALIVICMIITAAAAIGIIFIMILGLNGHTLSSFNVNVGYGWGESMLIKEETFSIKDIRRFSLESGSYGVYVRAVDGVTASVRQYSNHSDSPFTMDKTGSEVSVNARQNGVSIGLFFIWNRRIEIDIPRSWAGDVNFTTSSGGLTLEDNFKWAVASLQASSGGINIKYPLTTESLSLRASSGGIRISDGLTAGKQIQIRATSGGVRADGLIAADGLEISVTSGGVNMGGAVIDVNSLNVTTSSGGATLGVVKAGKFDMRATSGGIKAEELTGYGSVSSSSGGVRVETLRATGDVNLRTTSGSLRVGLPRNLSFKLEARTNSGGISSDFPMSYRGERRKDAYATVGSEPYVNLNLSASSGGITIWER